MSSTLLPITSSGGVTSESFTFANGTPVSLAPYVTINEGTGNIDATSTLQFVGNTAGYFVSATSSSDNYNLWFNTAVGDTAGNMYVVGGNQDNERGSIWSFGANGALRWSCSVDQIAGNNAKVDCITYNADNNTVVISLEWYDGASDQDGYMVLNATDGTVTSSTLLSTPVNSNPYIGDIALDANAAPILVGAISGDAITTTGLTAQTGSTTNQLWVNAGDLPVPVDPGNSPTWEVDISGGVGAPNWVSTSSINWKFGCPLETMTGSGSGGTAAVRWTGLTNTYDYEYPENQGSGYNVGDRVRVRGSNLNGVDNTDITAQATSSSDVDSNTVAVFDKATYPTLGSVQAGWYAFFPSGLAYRVAAAAVDTGTTWEIAVESNSVDFTGPVMFTGGGNDCVMYVGGTYNGQLQWLANVWAGTSVSEVVFTVGTNTDFSSGGPWSVRYSLNGQASIWTPDWQHTYGDVDWQQFVSVARDANSGSIYTLGRFYTAGGGNPRRVNLMKIDSSGTTQWSKYVEDSQLPNGNPGSVAVDGSGNVYVIASNNNDYSVVTKLDSDGTVIWQSRQTNNNNWDNEPRGAVDSLGNVYLFGVWYDNNLDADVLSLLKLNNADGTLAWARFIANQENYGFNEFYNDETQPIHVSGDHIYVAAYVNDTNNNWYDGFAAKLPLDGSALGTYGRWVYMNDSNASFEDNTPDAISEDNNNGVPVDQVTQTVTGDSATVTADNVGSTTTYTDNAMFTGGGGIVFADGTMQTTAAGAGSITSINNGTSNVAIADPDSNVVISVSDNNMSWTFATDRKIYGKADEDLTIAVVDDADDGYQLRQEVVDASGTQYARTRLERSSFRIELDLDGASPSWQFDGNQLQVNQDSVIRGFDNSVVLQSMYAGRNPSPKASVQSVSNNNDPNIFSTLDATTTGANIKVYNGGSVGGTEYAWQFDNQGNLTLPGNTFAVNYANGTQVSLGGGSNLPADAPGYLQNNGSGVLTWNTNTAGSGIPSYSDVWVNSTKADSFWTGETLTGNILALYTGIELTVSSQAVYGKQMSSGDKVLVVNDAPVHGQTYGLLVNFPASPAVGDCFSVPFVGQGILVTAGAFVVGQTYVINQPNDTNFVAIGASSNTPNTVFTATGAGTGSGTAYLAPGVLRVIFKPASGQRAFTNTNYNSGSSSFGQGTTFIAAYNDVTGQMGSQPITFVYAGVIDSIPTWYQLFF